MLRHRGMSIVVLVATLFAVNVVARLIIRFGFHDDDTAQSGASIAMFGLIGLILAVVTFLRAQRVAPAEWLPEVGGGALGGMLLTVVVGPFISGANPFTEAGDYFFSQIALYVAFAVLGTLIGYWVAIMLGRDFRSRSLKAYQAARARQRRVVRR
jgi:membrane associated rhomboid family serine protease